MELVYLWVEDYKNIQKQGFNFSPKFSCNYNEEKNELTIDENDDYIENFFGENINVTAIVGKNGSGKSNLLKLILKCIHSNSFLRGIDSSFLFVFQDENKMYFKHIGLNPSIQNISDLNLSNQGPEKVKDFFSLHYDNSFSYIKESSTYQVELLSNLIFAPNKLYNEENSTITFDENEEKKIIIRYLMDNKHYKTYGKYFEPNRVSVDGKYEKFNFIDNKQVHINFEKIRKNLQSNLDNFKMQVLLYGCEIIKNDYHKDNYDFLLDKNTLNKLEDFIENFSLSSHGKNITSRRLKKVHNYLKLLHMYAAKLNSILLKEEDERLIDFGEEEFLSHFVFNVQEFEDEEYIELLSMLPPCFSINIRDDTLNLNYEDLSSGEQSVLRIRFYIEDILLKNKNKSFTILLDEPANDMHPEWQRRLLNYLVETFKNRKQKIHFIFTSHSPFMISDLLKQNIIFLKDGKNDKGMKDKQTFGANIHTLLSDSFFMEDGLMGEFAKGKINEIIDFFNNKNNIYEDDKKRLKQIIETIGEAFLKDKLLHMYNEKYPKTDEEKIKDLEQEIESIKNGQN